MKTIFIPLLVPFFNFENRIVGAIRIYRGLVVIDGSKEIPCKEGILTLSYGKRKIHAYVELEKPPLFKAAMKFMENILLGKNISDKDPFIQLFSSEGAIVVNPSGIAVSKCNINEAVLIAVFKEAINNVPSSKMEKEIPLNFTKLSQYYSREHCKVGFFSEISKKYAQASSCINENMFFLVKRNTMEKAIEELILKGVDPDEIYVLGLFSKCYIVSR